jgi:hypothetical protein
MRLVSGGVAGVEAGALVGALVFKVLYYLIVVRRRNTSRSWRALERLVDPSAGLLGAPGRRL